MTLDEYLIPAGQMWVGGDKQGNLTYRIGYDTMAAYTVVPLEVSSSSSSGWFDPTKHDAQTTVYDSYTFTQSYGYDASIESACELAVGPVCLNDKSDTSGEESTCAQLAYCLQTSISHSTDYDGILGLGKYDGSNAESNYVIKNYLANQQNNIIAFDYNYNDTAIPSWMTIGGEYNLDSRTQLGTQISDATFWNINLKNVKVGASGRNTTSVSAALAS